MVGITARELEAIQTWNPRGFLAACQELNPKGLTDLERETFLSSAEIAEAVARVGAKQAEVVGKLLRGRLAKGRPLALSSTDTRILLQPGEKTGHAETADGIVITLDETTVAELGPKLRAKAGRVAIPSSDRIASTSSRRSSGIPAGKWSGRSGSAGPLPAWFPRGQPRHPAFTRSARYQAARIQSHPRGSPFSHARR